MLYEYEELSGFVFRIARHDLEHKNHSTALHAIAIGRRM